MAGEFSSGIRLEVGSKIRDYQVCQVFDPGAFAFSCEARTDSGRKVFLKKYKMPGMATAWYARFVQHQIDIKNRIQSNPAAKSLSYEFIDCFSHEKVGSEGTLRAFYSVFEFFEERKDLAQFLAGAKRQTPLERQQCLLFSKVLMAGVGAIHSAGIIHADLKPENVILVKDSAVRSGFRLRMIDFDYSLLQDKQAPWHSDLGYVGTPGYMSPEHLLRKVPQCASDIFTCGIMLAQLLGQGHPCQSNMDAYAEQVKTNALAQTVVLSEIPGIHDQKFLAHILNACLRVEPDRRPKADAVVRALNNQLMEFDGIRANDPPNPQPVTLIQSEVVQLGAPDNPLEEIRIDMDIGRRCISTWYPEDAKRFVSSEQFRLFRNSEGKWNIKPLAGATYATYLNGVELLSSQLVATGDRIAIGHGKQCELVIRLAKVYK